MNISCIKNIFLPVVFLTTGFAFGQISEFRLLEVYIEKENWQKADSISRVIDYDLLDNNLRAKHDYFKGIIFFSNGFYAQGFEFLNKAKKIYEIEDYKYELALTLEYLIECVNYVFDKRANQEEYINSYCNLAIELKDYHLEIKCEFFKGTYAFDGNNIKEGIENYKNATQIALLCGDSIKYYNCLINEGMLIGYHEKQPSKAIDLYTKIIPHFTKRKDPNRLYSCLVNLSYQYYFLDDIPNAIQILKEADTISLKRDQLPSKEVIYSRLSAYYEIQKEFEKSLKYSRMSDSIKDKYRFDLQQGRIRIIEEELNNKKLKSDNIEAESKRKQNRNIALGLGGGLAAVSIFAFLVYKNTKRKQRIAEQEKELEIQKKEKILKDQELSSIDAMIEGQEKERQRLASDLHDSVGATLSAAKMHFDHLAKNTNKLESQQELIEKTGSLLEDAYAEIRSMAHLKNSGVMAKKGLLPAVKRLARNASSNNGLSLEVQDFGLTEKLEGSLEISIFRIIQELVTNIIKHAQATEAQISITQHEDSLNIIVEDNGQGFNPQKNNATNGMGLHGIKKRLAHLEGTLGIDSTLGKGTHILIDIPL